jgi:phosphopantothenoylcysteine decarboxylase/phosphopantothenate--cysteine ligase
MKKDGRQSLTVEFAVNPDIIAGAGGPRLVKVAFAAETGEAAEKAAPKAAAKGAVFVVANDVTEPGSGFGTDTNRVAIVSADGRVERLPLMDKLAVAHAVLDRAKAHFK